MRLVDEHVDGLVPVASLGDDYYELREESHELVGRSGGRVFRLADEVSVVVERVDVHRRTVDLSIEGMPPGQDERVPRRRRRNRESDGDSDGDGRERGPRRRSRQGRGRRGRRR